MLENCFIVVIMHYDAKIAAEKLKMLSSLWRLEFVLFLIYLEIHGA